MIQSKVGLDGPEPQDPAGRQMTLADVAAFSGEELLVRFGKSTMQQLIDLIVAAIRKGDDDEVAAVDVRLREVERLASR